ncbi:unnamed protein product [Psylliodes chrysocephalus]|uniref:STAS domain-containing protein n=1 Tax=Psylliodes chrysocephalus TaxID=3402493 RepID=A0A9P0CGM7_9CUCU|nr:unnamed protein product [Psylliodes chrysocephala]
MSQEFDEESNPQINIHRRLYEHDQLRQDFMYEKPKFTYLKPQCTPAEVKCQKIIYNTFPILNWLLRYNWRKDLLPDFIAGLTLAIMNIPQGMAYGLLAKTSAVVGMYTTFFPVLIYIILGTSRHNSMGTFAITSLMVGKVVLEHSDTSYFPDNMNNNNETVTIVPTGYSPTQVASALSLVVALVQLLMFILRLGAVSVLLSDTLVSGFTTGAAIQVFVSQLKDLLGIKLPDLKGYFVTIKTLQTLIEKIQETNYATLTISAIVILILIINVQFLKPMVAKKSAIPVPVELFVIAIATIISKYCDLKGEYGVKIVGTIPTGFPDPTPPPLDLIYKVLLEGVTIAIVTYSISYSMAMVFAQKNNYEVDPNQELLAMGASNIFGSFFSSMPVSASLTRSMLASAIGGKTQIVAVIGCVLLVFVLLWLGPIFELVPKCILASVIVVALKGLLLQVKEVMAFWKLSKLDALVWVITCLTVVLVSIDIGLLVGIGMSLATIFYLSFKPNTCILASIPSTDLYLDSKRYKGCREIVGLKIFQYSGGINFATRNIFKSDLFTLIGIDPQKEIINRTKLYELEDQINGNKEKINKLRRKVDYSLKCLIMDFSTVSCVDPSGIAMLKSVIESFEKINVPVYIVGCTDSVYNLMEKCGLLTTKSSFLRLFPSIHDAVKCYSNVFDVSIERAIHKISVASM